MVSALAVDTWAEGAGPVRHSAPAISHTGVYRLAKVDGRKANGISGMLFLREDRGCVLRLVLPSDQDRKLIRLLRGIWWPVPVGIKTLTSDGCLGVWAADWSSVTIRFPLAAPRATLDRTTGTCVKFVRVR